MRKTNHWIIFIIIAVSLLIGVSIAFRNQTAIIRFFSTDDAFYYFQVARNITAGNGITFDGIARGNGYHPLWMLICIPVFALSRFNLWLPLRVLIVIHAIIHAATGFLLYKLLVKKVSQPLAVLAASVWLFSQEIFVRSGSKGLETGINLLCVAALFYYISTWSSLKKEKISWKNYVITGFLAALTLLARLDNVYLICFLGAWLVLKDSTLSRRWIFVDFFLVAASVIFGYFRHVGFTDVYYSMIPKIELIIILSLVLYPIGQFVFGLYHTQKGRLSSKAVIFRSGVGAASSFVIEAIFLMILFPQGGYSRIALFIQGLFFVLATVIIKLILPVSEGEQREKLVFSWFPHWREVIKLNWRDLITNAVGYFGPVFSFLGVFLVFNHFYFGSSMPLSGKIKVWWGGLSTIYGNRARTIVPFLGFDDKGPWYTIFGKYIRPLVKHISLGNFSSEYIYLILVGILILIVFGVFLKSKKFQKTFSFYSYEAFTLGILFHFGYYTMTGYVGYRGWYWTIEYFYLIILSVLFLDAVLSMVCHQFSWLEKKKWLGGALGVIGVALMIFTFTKFTFDHFPFTPDEETAYLHNTRALEATTESGSLIGMTGGGVEAYFINDRTIVNLDGLINGIEYYEYLTDMRLDEYLDQIDVDYIFGKEYVLLQSEPYMIPFAGRIELLDPPGWEFDDSMRLFRFVEEQ